MSVPMRKDDFEEDLTTADLAQGKRPAASPAPSPVPSEDRPKPVLAERPRANASRRNSGKRLRRRRITRAPVRCSPTTNWKILATPLE